MLYCGLTSHRAVVFVKFRSILGCDFSRDAIYISRAAPALFN